MLRSLIKNYLIELKMKSSSQNTFRSYGFHLDKFANFMEQHKLEYTQLTPKQAKLFRNQMVEQGLKPRTINTILGAVKSFYDFLVEDEEVNGNPIITKRLKVKEAQSLPAFMTESELKIFRGWLTGIPKRMALGFRIMLATGIRVSEVCALAAEDTILLEDGTCVLRIRHGKGNKERYVPVMEVEVAEELATMTVSYSTDGSTLLGVTNHAFKWWARQCRLDTGLKFSSHRCRHTVGTNLLQKGVPIDKVQEVLGHADISTTRRYAKTAPESIYELAAKIDRVKETGAMYRYVLLDIEESN